MSEVTENKEVETQEEELVTLDPIQALEARIKELEDEVAVTKNAYFKAYADTENLKKRLQQESDNVRKYRVQAFATEILPVIDNLERALGTPTDDDNIKNFLVGFQMIYDQLLTALKNEGVQEIESLNQAFNPNLHQALMSEAVEGVEPNTVVEVFQKGYQLKDRVLRCALVKVSA